MASPLLCLTCYDTPMSPGSRFRCFECGRLRCGPLARAAGRQRHGALRGGGGVAVGFMLASAVGVGARAHVGRAKPGRGPIAVAISGFLAAGESEVPPPGAELEVPPLAP